ncbi:MAG: hypothetical protein AAGL24_21990 [Pseudomonadota bacterium]
MTRFSGLIRGACAAGLALSLAGCGSMLSGDPYSEDLAETGEKDSLSYSLSRKIVTGFGGQSSGTQKNISYAPRGPLAVPPAMELKEPEDAQQVTAEMPNWPKESNEADAYIASLEEAKTHRERTRDDWENPVIPGREMARYRVIGGGRQGNEADNDQGDQAPVMTREQAEQFSEDVKEFRSAEIDGVPRRQYLIEPPSSYRTPDAGSKLPSKVKVKSESKADDWENPGGY